MAGIKTGDVFNFSYTGGIQSITLPKGEYKLECWGARGGYFSGQGNNFGGYSIGTYKPNKPGTLYLVCGGSPNDSINGGYNGGGSGSVGLSKGGGGATHIGLKSGLLTDFSGDYSTQLLLVAGGSGGMGYRNYSKSYYKGGAGGGETGANGTGYSDSLKGKGGTQTAGGSGYESGGFGFGGTGRSNGANSGSGGGGAGFYGGGGGKSATNLVDVRTAAGGGGSGYVNTSLLTNASTTQQSSSTNPDTTNYAGYIRITVIKVASIDWKVNVNGSWKNTSAVYVNINGTWKEASEAKTNVNGTWK